jgi:hypothetical protein
MPLLHLPRVLLCFTTFLEFLVLCCCSDGEGASGASLLHPQPQRKFLVDYTVVHDMFRPQCALVSLFQQAVRLSN